MSDNGPKYRAAMAALDVPAPAAPEYVLRDYQRAAMAARGLVPIPFPERCGFHACSVPRKPGVDQSCNVGGVCTASTLNKGCP